MLDISKADFSDMTQEDMVAKFDEIKRYYPISHIFFADSAEHECKRMFGVDLHLMDGITKSTTTVSKSITEAKI